MAKSIFYHCICCPFEYMLFPIKYFYIYIYTCIYIYKLTLIKGVLCSNFQYKIADIHVAVKSFHLFNIGTWSLQFSTLLFARLTIFERFFRSNLSSVSKSIFWNERKGLPVALFTKILTIKNCRKYKTKIKKSFTKILTIILNVKIVLTFV